MRPENSTQTLTIVHSGIAVKRVEVLTTKARCNDWCAAEAKFFVLGDNHNQCRLIGANLMPQLGLALVQRDPTTHQQAQPGKHIKNIVNNGDTHVPTHSHAEWAHQLFPDIFRRTGRFNNHVVRTKFKTPFVAKQQKGGRIPLALQNRVAEEIERLINAGHLERLQSCTDDQFISPIIITVKRDGSLKLALDSKELNKMVSQNKYQMPNIEDLMDRIADMISSKGRGKVWFTSIDLNYAYGQLLLALETARQCNCSLVEGAATGTYRFLTGFYGLADMPAEFQQAIDRVLTGTKGTNAFIDD